MASNLKSTSPESRPFSTERPSATDQDNTFDSASVRPMLFTETGTVGGAPVDGVIAGEDPRDLFRFVAEQTGRLQIAPSNLSYSARIRLYDENGILLDSQSNFAGTEFTLDANVSAGRTYFIEVEPNYSFNESVYQPIEYRIETSFVEFEPRADFNNNFESADIWQISNDESLDRRFSNPPTAFDYSVGGSLDPDDYFTFTAVSDDILTLRFYDKGGDFNLVVYDSSRTVIAQNDSNGVAPDLVSLEVEAGEQYFVHVDASGDEGGYLLGVNFGDGDEFFDSSRSVSLDDIPFGNLSETDPWDYLDFVPDETGLASLTLSTFDRPLELQVYDSAQTLIDEISVTADNSNTADFPVTAGNTYYLRVAPSQPYAAIEGNDGYRLTGSITVLPPDNNDLLSDAEMVEVPYVTNSDVGAMDQDDFFQFDAPENGRAEITLSGLTDNLDLRVYTAIGELIAESTSENAGDESLILAVTENETYYVRVSPNPSAYSEYELRIRFSVRNEDAASEVPGSTLTERTLLLNEQTEGEVETAGDSDWFALIVPEGSTYVVSATGTGDTPLDNPDLVLRNEDGTFIDQNVEEDGNSAELVISEAGSYLIDVRSFTGGTGTYTLAAVSPSTAGSPNISQDIDIASDTSSNTALGIGEIIESRLDNTTDSDWFQISVEENDQVQIRLSGSESNVGTLSDGTLVLRDEEGEFIEQVSGAPGSNTELTVANPGTYWIDVQSASGLSGTYRLSATSNLQSGGDGNDIPPTGGLDIPGDIDTTVQLSAGSNVSSNLETARDSDWFKIVNIPGDALRITIEGSENGAHTLLDPDLVLRDSAGNFLDQSVGDTGRDIVYDLNSGGTYYLDIRSYTGETGSYSVSVDYIVQSSSQITTAGQDFTVLS